MEDKDSAVPRIVGMAVTVPKETFDLTALGYDADAMRRTMKLTGVHQVRTAPPEKTAADYCTDAAERLLRELGIASDMIDGIIFATPHPDYIYPGNCGIVQSRLHIPQKCIAMDINHSCTGMIYGIFVASMMIRTGAAKNVLVCCGDTATKHTNPKDRALRMVQGDGGGAVIVADGGTEEMAFSFCHDGDGVKHLYVPAGGDRMPLEAGVTDVEVTDAEGNVRTLADEYMDGMEVMRFVMNEMPKLVEDVLQQKGWSKETVDLYAFHQANAFIVQSLARKLKISKEKALLGIEGYGNIGGSSVFLALCKAAMNQDAGWEKTVFCTFGTGMSGAAMTADLTHTHFYDVSEI